MIQPEKRPNRCALYVTFKKNEQWLHNKFVKHCKENKREQGGLVKLLIEKFLTSLK